MLIVYTSADGRQFVDAASRDKYQAQQDAYRDTHFRLADGSRPSSEQVRASIGSNGKSLQVSIGGSDGLPVDAFLRPGETRDAAATRLGEAAARFEVRNGRAVAVSDAYGRTYDRGHDAG